ncbi:MAG: polysaccharide deacetylase family protein [Anaerolineaceae bacterium]|nr:polysaccharide deacetylase family protein [Anaerolineaceae bacterium]
MLLVGCAQTVVVANGENDISTSVAMTLTAQPTATATPDIPTATSTPEPTATPTITPTPTMVYNPAGKVIVPILLYHHIADTDNPNRYYVPPSQFEEQMAWLAENGYTSVSVTRLIDVLINGGELPARPFVITFDDGDTDVYTQAFPIMKKYGFTGTFYIIAGWRNTKTVVTDDMLNEMIAAGWEIGSHSMSHIDLTKNHDSLDYQVVNSKAVLEDVYQTSVKSFAYPFGLIDRESANKVVQAGYIAGMGLGVSTTHTMYDIYYLNRREIQSDYDLNKFKSLLPWQ